MAEPLIAVRGLRKSFGGLRATDRVDLDVEDGETRAIIGPNGAGKTTLIGQLAPAPARRPRRGDGHRGDAAHGASPLHPQAARDDRAGGARHGRRVHPRRSDLGDGLRPHHRHREPRGGPRQRRGSPRLPRRGDRVLMLTVDSLETAYGVSQVLFGVSLRIDAGQVVTLLGRNGMGKTTTVRSIMGIVRPRAGEVRFLGRPIHGLPSYRVAQTGIGLVPEGRQVFPNLTLRENLVATAANRGGHGDPWTVEKVLDLFPQLAG